MKPTYHYRKLREESRKSCRLRNHEMRPFGKPTITRDGTAFRAITHCKRCGAYVQVDTHPQPNGIDIGGSAVAVDCAGHFPYAYQIVLTREEYRSAQVMNDRGYLGMIVDHASFIDDQSECDSIILHFIESDAWKVNETIEEDPDAVWALTTPSTSLGEKFQKFIDSIV